MVFLSSEATNAAQTARGSDCALACALLADSEHRTANHFALLASYVRLRAPDASGRDADPSAVRLFVLGLDAHIVAIARLHRLLSAAAPAEALPLSCLLEEVGRRGCGTRPLEKA